MIEKRWKRQALEAVAGGRPLLTERLPYTSFLSTPNPAFQEYLVVTRYHTGFRKEGRNLIR